MTHPIHALFARHWRPTPTLVAAGLLAALYYGFTGGLWAVTGEFTRWGGNLLQLCGVDVGSWAYFKAVALKGHPWDRPDGWMIAGMFLGAMTSALASREFKFRAPARHRRWVQGLIGGLLAGFGSRLAMGCNLASFFTGLPQFSLHSWLFIVGTAFGAWIASRLVMTAWFRGAPKLSETPVYVVAQAATSRASFAGLFGVAVLLALAMLNLYLGHAKFAGVMVAGAAFGVLLQRGQICFTSALRDLWLTGRTTMAKAIILGMAAQTVITAILIARGMTPIIHWASPGALFGGVMFGLGIVIAGGCETGWMYRLMEGQTHFVAVALGNVIGATVLAYGWDHWGLAQTLAVAWPEIDLVKTLGMTGALAATFAFLAACYAFVVFREARYLQTVRRPAVTPLTSEA
ncbi:putative membrane protein YedE/YeeE [Rhodoblastus acidophilus]|uniref:selenium metabolism membrane protein YedE/FdhT n=1 Tax=Rhodoblastus acidophilus TaxID=1074 RepID=UPI0022244884|nr:selenium metabolism membrane protein YedE/FdhT [Rhodoblastus acidophilus]MCW2285401.1 putative membrane protein YedE/YeeE [Rhodoblastus acidophilus]MCW2334350.1 putative membrane protein YedE/YeeE [Rhodoblastus acidophilus]